MKNISEKLVQATFPQMPSEKGFKIGCIGSGFIMAECQLSAYAKNGFCVEGIASRTYENAKKVADRYGIRKAYKRIEELIADPETEIVDIALPPHVQKDIVRLCCEQKHIKGILCQKPLAVSMDDMREISDMCRRAGIKVAVNQNMRYDQSIRALKYALEEGYLGKPVLASIDLRALAGVQPFFRDYGRFEILDLAIHHLDCFRYLFGDPEKIIAVCRTDPRTPFEHKDGLSEYILQYEDGLIANSIDDGYAGPDAPCVSEHYINWRVEGTEGIAAGSIGWHEFPKISPSRFRLGSVRFPGEWIEPEWETAWFPDAFAGTMADLMCALEEDREPVINVEDNIVTMACVEACYRSIEEERTVYLKELL